MASTAERVIRIAAGTALIAWGLLGLGGTTGIIIAVFGAPFSGSKIRAAK